MPEIILSLSSHTVLILLGAGAAIAAAAWAYRRTTPVVSRGRRLFLAALRAASVALIVVMLGEPVLSIRSRTEEPPSIAVLIDNSRSMGINDAFEHRRATLEAVLSSPELRGLQSIGTPRFVLFDRTAREVASLDPDSVVLNGDVTDIAEALRFVEHRRRQENIRAVVLVSDGTVTEGGNPTYELDALGLPVYTVCVGDTSARRDVRVHAVLTNAVAYVGTKVPVQVDIRSNAYSGERIEVLLRSDEGVIDRQVLELGPGSRRYDLTMTLTPAVAGVHRYSVELTAPKDDAVAANNRSSFYVKVLKSKLNVVFLAGAPSADIAFIRRSLESNATLTAQFFLEQFDGTISGGSLTQAVLENADCLLLVGYPTNRSAAESFGRIGQAIHNGKNVLVVVEHSTDVGKLNSLQPELPASFAGANGIDQEAFLSVVPSERMSPLLRGAEQSDPVAYWSKLPPVVLHNLTIVPRVEAHVLLEARFQNVTSRQAVYISRQVGRHKALLFAASGLWQWNMHRSDEQSDPVGGFLTPAVRWLSTREEEKALRVKPVKEVFSGQEQIELVAQLYDATLRPVDDAEVRVRISGGKHKEEILARPLGSGRYLAVFEGLREGTYAFTAQATQDGVDLGSDRGSFSVGELTVEYQDVRPSAALLEQLSDKTGGRFYRGLNIQGLGQAIQSHPQFESSPRNVTSSVELWNDPVVLALLVVLLATEWTIRKRSGML